MIITILHQAQGYWHILDAHKIYLTCRAAYYTAIKESESCTIEKIRETKRQHNNPNDPHLL